MKDNQQFTFYSDKISYKTVEGKNGKEYFVTGYISTGDVDLVNDVVTKNCSDSMLNQFKDRTIKLDFEHEAFRGKSIIESEANKTKIVLGKAVSQEVDSKGVLTTWKLNDTWKKYDEKGNVTMTFKDLWKNVEEGFYDAFSIAYIPTKTSTENREGKNIRLLDNVNLLNVALTGNPVNPGAGMTAVMAKSLAYMKSIEEEELLNVEIKGFERIEQELADLKAKYTRRTGSPGNYSYEYPDDKKPGKPSGKPDKEGSKQPSKESNARKERFVESSLVNDENGTDKEIRDHFVSELNISKEEADFYVSQRDDAFKDPMGFKLKPYTEKKSNPEEQKALNDKTNKRSNMENKDEEVKPDAEAETPEPEAKAPKKTEEEDEDKEDKPEKKSFAELKDKVVGLETEVKDLKKENTELKAIVEKPRHKGLGAEDAEKKSQTTDTKSVGALDAIKG